MTTHVTATFVNGVLRPDEVLPLADQSRVKLTVEPLVDQLEPMEAWESLKAWLREKPLRGLGRHLTRDELHERR